LCIGLTLLFPKYKYLYIFIAILVVMSRVILNFHYLSDTLFGSFLGGITALYIYQKHFMYSTTRQPDSVAIVS
jgi:membrane-associated phospholipid phosphatase